MTETIAIEFDSLTKKYRNTTPINQLSLNIYEGEVFGLLGPNGSGKTTTVETLLDISRPSSGEVEVYNLDPARDVVEIHHRIGYLPGEDALLPKLTGEDHIRYIANSKGVSVNPDHLLRQVGIEDAGTKRSEEYSTGMKRRLGIALALVGEPDIYILDEPFAGLDPNGVMLVKEIIRKENKRGATVLISSNNLNVVLDLCDRLGVLSDGRLVAKGTIEDLRREADMPIRSSVPIEGCVPHLEEIVSAIAGVTDAVVENGTITFTVDSDSGRQHVLEKLRDVCDEIGTPEIIEPDIETVFSVLTNGTDQ